MQWYQGEHVSLIGPTGGGKTYLATRILEKRNFVVALAAKPQDRTMTKLIASEGYIKQERFDPKPIDKHHPKPQRIVLWPPLRGVDDVAKQGEVFDLALRQIFLQGKWCVFADELSYLCNYTKLTKHFELIWMQGRSLGLSLVGGIQRPYFVPLLAYDQPTHLFFWRDTDEANLKRIGGIGWLNSRNIRECVASLPKHEVLYINTRNGTMVRTKVSD
jgi:hypothetical protein